MPAETPPTHGLVSLNTASLYQPLNAVPDGFQGTHRYVHVIGRDIFIDDRLHDTSWSRHFVGIVEGVGWWAVDVDGQAPDPSAGGAVDLRTLLGTATSGEWLAAGRAAQTVAWVRTHQFCGRCATPTEPSTGERGLRCPSCDLVAYPRVAPAMIVLVTKGPAGPNQEVLLARGVRFPQPMYSCLAGFVEPGEDLEGAVVREVLEEVGVEVDDVRYSGSQPWPFPHSIMIGFRAQWTSGDIVRQESEILDANWYRRDAMPRLPPPETIAGRLIRAWFDEV